MKRSERDDKIFADRVNNFVGSGAFIIGQSIFLVAYMIYQLFAGNPFDPYPFVLCNLILSFQAAYTGPFVIWSQNRAAARDREVIEHIRSMVEQIGTLVQQIKSLEEQTKAKIEEMEDDLESADKRPC
jgi:uncharacterized membrane protein